MVRKQKTKTNVKSIFCIALLFLLVLPASALSINPQPPDELPGDIDHSGTVDMGDVILALQACANITPHPSVSIDTDTDADVNGDDNIGLKEGIYALQVVSKIRP